MLCASLLRWPRHTCLLPLLHSFLPACLLPLELAVHGLGLGDRSSFWDSHLSASSPVLWVLVQLPQRGFPCTLAEAAPSRHCSHMTLCYPRGTFLELQWSCLLMDPVPSPAPYPTAGELLWGRILCCTLLSQPTPDSTCQILVNMADAFLHSAAELPDLLRNLWPS